MDKPKPYKPFSYLQDHEVKPPAAVWDAIDAGLGQNRRRRRLFILWRNSLVALGLGSAIFAAYLLNTGPAEQKTTAVKNIPTKKTITPRTLPGSGSGSFSVSSSAEPTRMVPVKETGFVHHEEPAKGSGSQPSEPVALNPVKSEEITPEVQPKKSAPLEGIIKVASSTPYRSEAIRLNKLQARGVNLLKTNPLGSTLIVDYHAANKGVSPRSKHFIEAYYLPMVKFSRFHAPDAAPVYVQLRDSSENPEFGYAAGFRAGYRFNERFFVSAGLQFSKHYDKFRGDYKTRSVIDVYDTTYISMRPRAALGKPTLYGVTYLHRSDTLIHVRPLKQNIVERSVSVPLSTGICFDKEEVIFTIQVGAVFNVFRSYSGEMIDPKYVEQSVYIQNSKYPFTLKQSTDLWFSPGIEWRVSKHHSLVTEPRYQYRLGNVYGADYPVNLRWQNLGILAGWRVWL